MRVSIVPAALLLILAPAQAAAPESAAGGWSWPLSPRPAVLRPFEPPGRVSFVGVVVDRPVLTIDHGNGLRSSFEPVESTLRPGDAVAEGAVVGRALPGHCGGTPCIHWGVRHDDAYLNPLAFVMDLRPSILLPPVDPVSGLGGSG